jgi:hypothetical protein
MRRLIDACESFPAESRGQVWALIEMGTNRELHETKAVVEELRRIVAETKSIHVTQDGKGNVLLLGDGTQTVSKEN